MKKYHIPIIIMEVVLVTKISRVMIHPLAFYHKLSILSIADLTILSSMDSGKR